MNQIIGLENYKRKNGSTICLGTFDGFHRGHQKLVETSEFLVTFDPHPKNVLSEKSTIERLSFPSELRYFFPNILIIPFTKETANMSPDEFLNTFIEPLKPTQITIGYDFKFGKYGQGDIKLLEAWGKENKCKIIEIKVQKLTNNIAFKSSIIRKSLKTDPDFAFELLGHPYLIEGNVIKGDNRGHAIGFPTANIKIPSNKCVPKFGVYESQTIIKGKMHSSITYIGKKPTFENNEASIETHILENFSTNIYNETIQVLFKRFIRDDVRFKSKDELINQIKKDIQSIIN